MPDCARRCSSWLLFAGCTVAAAGTGAIWPSSTKRQKCFADPQHRPFDGLTCWPRAHTLLPAENTLTVARGLVGSYPNTFYRIDHKALPDFTRTRRTGRRSRLHLLSPTATRSAAAIQPSGPSAIRCTHDMQVADCSTTTDSTTAEAAPPLRRCRRDRRAPGQR